MLYAPQKPQHDAIKVIKFFHMVKLVIIRSGDEDRKLNLRIFIDLINELRVKLDIIKAGLVPDKIKSLINASQEDNEEAEKKRQQRMIEKIILSEFSTISLAKV